MQHDKPAPSTWSARFLALASLSAVGASVYYALTLLSTRCESFSCTYLGVAWIFWLGVLFLPATAFGYFAQRSMSLPTRSRSVLRAVWHAHSAFSFSLLAWWLVHRV